MYLERKEFTRIYYSRKSSALVKVLYQEKKRNFAPVVLPFGFFELIIGSEKRLDLRVFKMFRYKIPQKAKDAGIENAFQLAKALGVGPMTAARLWSGDFERLDLKTIHRLCDLFQCQISEFLYWDGKKLGE